MEKQKMVDEAIAANTASIHEIDKEIKVLSKENGKETMIGSSDRRTIQRRARKCRYYDCKYKYGCRYIHPRDICMNYLDSGKCGLKDCADRHPKVCKIWAKGRAGCKRDDVCDFLHVTLVQQDDKSNMGERLADQEYTCIGCKSSWKDSRFVVNHTISNQSVNSDTMFKCYDEERKKTSN